MGKLFLEYLQNRFVYSCKVCKVHLANREQLVSKDFMSGDGRAFLFNRVVNYNSGQNENRMLRTGNHIVCDVFCKSCQGKIGWSYIWAEEPGQKYKEGKIILEKNLIEKMEWSER